MAVRAARSDEIEELLPLVRGYCEFYGSDPGDAALRRVLAAIIDLPEDRELALVATGDDGRPVGIAICAFRWSTLRGARTLYLADLYVAPEARGRSHAGELIAAVADVARRHGALDVSWLTAPDNHRARAVYERAGAQGEPYIEYELEI